MWLSGEACELVSRIVGISGLLGRMDMGMDVPPMEGYCIASDMKGGWDVGVVYMRGCAGGVSWTGVSMILSLSEPAGNLQC